MQHEPQRKGAASIDVDASRFECFGAKIRVLTGPLRFRQHILEQGRDPRVCGAEPRVSGGTLRVCGVDPRACREEAEASTSIALLSVLVAKLEF